MINLNDKDQVAYGYSPKMAQNQNFPAIRNMFKKAEGHEQMFADGSWKKMKNDYGNLVANAGVEINGKPSLITTYDKSGLPSPYISPFEQVLLNAVYAQKSSGLKYIDKAGGEHILNQNSANLASDIARIYGINVGQLKKDDQDVPLNTWEAIEYSKNLISEDSWNTLVSRSPLTKRYGYATTSKDTREGEYRWPTDRAGGEPEDVYASYRAAINKPYISAFAGAKSKEGTALEQPIFDLGQYMQGNSADDMTAVGGAKYPIHTEYIDPLNLGERDITMMSEIIKILNGPQSTYAVGFGTPQTFEFIKTDGSEEAKNTVITTINNVIKDAKTGTKAQSRNAFQIKYYTGYGQGDADEYAAYQVQVSKKEALALQKYLTGETSGLITDSEKQLVTIRFKKSMDNNPLGMSDTRFSQVDYDIQRNDGVYNWNVPNGLGLKIWKEDGAYMRSYTPVMFNDKSGTIQVNPNTGPGRAAPITYLNGNPIRKKDLDVWLNNFQSTALQMHQERILIPEQTWKKNNPGKMVTYDIPKNLLLSNSLIDFL